LDEALVELSQLDVVCGAQVPRLGPLHCDAELVGLLQSALLAAELVHALDRGDEGLDRGERMRWTGLSAPVEVMRGAVRF
jgi:hypothetical protein